MFSERSSASHETIEFQENDEYSLEKYVLVLNSCWIVTTAFKNTVINQSVSEAAVARSGMPQGTCLHPVLP